MITKVDVSYTSRNPDSFLAPLRLISGSDVTFVISGVPGPLDGVKVAAVYVEVTNVKGSSMTVDASKLGGNWIVTIPRTFFTEPGIISAGYIVRASGKDAAGTAAYSWLLGIGDVEIIAVDTGAIPAPEEFNAADFVLKGADTYEKSRVVDGVQHYCKQTISYDEEMKAWGATWQGDYILTDGGEFQEVI